MPYYQRVKRLMMVTALCLCGSWSSVQAASTISFDRLNANYGAVTAAIKTLSSLSGDLLSGRSTFPAALARCRDLKESNTAVYTATNDVFNEMIAQKDSYDLATLGDAQALNSAMQASKIALTALCDTQMPNEQKVFFFSSLVESARSQYEMMRLWFALGEILNGAH